MVKVQVIIIISMVRSVPAKCFGEVVIVALPLRFLDEWRVGLKHANSIRILIRRYI